VKGAGNQQDQATCGESAGSDLSGWCRTGGIVAWILVAYSLATIVQILVLGGQPATAAEAFGLLHHNKILGLLRLDLPTVAAISLYYLLFLGLYAALRRSDRANVTLSLALVFVGVTLLLATPTALSMIPLSDKYAVAKTEATRIQILAAGEAVLATDIWHGTGAIIGGIFVQAGAVVISVVMLRSNVFSRLTAYVGIVTHGLDLVHILFGLFLPAAGFVLMALAGPLYLVWFPLVGRRLLQLAAEGRTLGMVIGNGDTSESSGSSA
jgi:hypothetical protein